MTLNGFNMVIKPIEKNICLELIFSNHYSKVMPRLTRHYLGGYKGGKLIGVLTLGWGTRPVHTIKKLFPTLDRKDYFEIGKMCLLEEMPKNTESEFLSKIISWIKTNEPSIKILFTWADGILGKPGYVYQASNFLYGGFIWTDLYISPNGEKIHPRTSQGLFDKGDKKCGHRPSIDFMIDRGWKHYRGKQFRYVYFLCNKKEKKNLLLNSLEKWGIDYPKNIDLKWKIQNLETGNWESIDNIPYLNCEKMEFNKTATKNKKIVDNIKKARTFFDFSNL
jgi:hypothetical protein